MTDTTTSAPSFPDKIEECVEQYVKLRDAISKADENHKIKTSGAREYLELLGGAMRDKLTDIGADSAKTPAGTVYKTIKKSATVADGSVFRKYVVDNAAFDLVDMRANAPAVSEYVSQNGGIAPPGLNYSTRVEVGVRRPTSKE
jgi:hypothetical protein